MTRAQAEHVFTSFVWSVFYAFRWVRCAFAARRWGPLIALGVLAVVPGCGSRAQDPVWEAVRSAVVQGTPAVAPSGSLAEQQAHIREALATSGYDGPLMMVTLPDRQAVATMAPVPGAGDIETWADASGITITLRQGVVIATRGTGFDLMASDMSRRISALTSQGPRSYEVITRHLDPTGHLRTVSTACTMDRVKDGWMETCGVSPEVQNWYAIRPDRSSRQWLGADVGPIHLERLQ